MIARTGERRRAVVWGIVLSIALAAFPAHADYDETEYRLKTAGVPEALRKRIHRAIRRGADYLLSRQAANGVIAPPRRFLNRDATEEGYSALCALALRHAAFPAAMEGAQRTISYLVPSSKRARRFVYRDVYTCSLTCLLLMADGRFDAVSRALGKELAQGLGNHDWWGYSTRSSTGENLSMTQFAGLGLWAAQRRGARVDPTVWRRHLKSLCDLQKIDGSWPYEPGQPHSYPTGTFMGIANLLLAQRGAASLLGKDEHLRERVHQTLKKGIRAVERDVPIAIRAFRDGFRRDYYALYALEKACIFLDRETVGGVSWYVEGARALVEIQRENGSWPTEDVRFWITGDAFKDRPILETTAFAVLFLLRAPATHHPTTPRPIDQPQTRFGTDPVQKAAEPPAQEVPSKIPLEVAKTLLDKLESRIASTKTRNEELLESLDAAAKAYGRLGRETEFPEEFALAAARWRARAEELLLDTLALTIIVKDRNLRDPVRVRAAEILGRTRPEVSPRLRDVLARHVFQVRYDVGSDLYDAGLGALARLGQLDSLIWMHDELARKSGRRGRNRRASAALRAMAAFGGVPGELRRKIVKELIDSYVDVESGARRRAESARTWEEVGAAVVGALQRFSTDPLTGRPASTSLQRDRLQGWVVSVAGYREWWLRHQDPKRSPWVDPPSTD